MEGGMCEDCKYSFETKGTDCGHHYRGINGVLRMAIPSETVLNRWGRCSYWKEYRINMDVMKKKLARASTAEEFSRIIMEFATMQEFGTDKDRIDWLKKESD